MKIKYSLELNCCQHTFWLALTSQGFRSQRLGYYQSKWVCNSSIHWVDQSESEGFHGKILQTIDGKFVQFLLYDFEIYTRILGCVTFKILQGPQNLCVEFSLELFANPSENERNKWGLWIKNHLQNLGVTASYIHSRMLKVEQQATHHFAN